MLVRRHLATCLLTFPAVLSNCTPFSNVGRKHKSPHLFFVFVRPFSPRRSLPQKDKLEFQQLARNKNNAAEAPACDSGTDGGFDSDANSLQNFPTKPPKKRKPSKKKGKHSA